MTFEFPEDCRRWPSDPFKLLGLERSTDEKTARRAYFKAIKKFKPDKFPAEFQLIRDAYEHVQQWLSWQSYSATKENDKPQPELGKHDPDQCENNPTGASSLTVDPFETFHLELRSGQVALAFATINRIEPSAGSYQTARASLTKYFLSRFFPQALVNSKTKKPPAPEQTVATELERKQLEWLLKTLNDTKFLYPVLGRLSVAFDANVRLATCEPVNRFLRNCENIETLDSVIRLRWAAIGCTDWRVVVDDFNSLKPRSLEFGSNWERLLVESLEYTVWHDTEPCQRHTQDGWDEISQSANSWSADATEILMLAAEQWRVLRTNTEWLESLPWARNALPQTLRQHFLPVAQAIVSDQDTALLRLNRLYQNYSLAMTVFEQGLQRLADGESDSTRRADAFGSDEEDWGGLREQVACFFHGSHYADYDLGRHAILDFCLANELHPFEFAQAANSFLQDSTAGMDWNRAIRNDGALLCMYYASQIVKLV